MLEPVSNKPNFVELEREILRFWEESRAFQRSVDQRRGAPEFVFYDGPPFATGLPHYGHLLAGTIKDVVPRYQTMRGHYVERRFGWDCHGLPVECEVEQTLGISGRTQIETLGVAAFNEHCRSIVLRYTREWRTIVTRMGRWVDFDHDYKTMDAAYMESIWWVFKALWDRGLIYEGRKILPYCPRCATPLSNFETNQGYAEVTDPAVTVRFRVEGEPNAYLLAWTTTPWTLPSNLALAVGREIPYIRVQGKDAAYYLAKSRLSVYYPTPSAWESLTEMPGERLVGLRYEPLFPYFASLRDQGAFRVVPADFVSTEEGTGIVHLAPGFGEDDYRLAEAEKLPVVCPVDAECRFTSEVPDYAGRKVKETDADILDRLKREGRLVHRGTLRHSYPHCWRCETPLIYRALATWFVRVEPLKERLLAANRQVHWVPEHLRDGRFGRWLEGARDWAISRNRYWGTPLPIWRSADGAETVCVGSREELAQRSGHYVSDLHKHHVDAIEIPSREGRGTLRRVPEVLDCWFESGAMPYAQAHYPFENRERFERHFPADFIAEGLDQTRGWFYTLMVLSVALFDRPAFRHVVVNGLVLAEDGRKMSKRLKNYPDPAYILDTYGADALRLYMLHSPVVRAEDLRFSEEGVKHVVRNLLIPWWNAYSFLVTYARVDGWRPTPDSLPSRPSHRLDCWILSALAGLVAEVTTGMEAYDLQAAVRPFVRFLDLLTNWYIRRSRRRFWKSQNDEDKAQAYATLYEALVTLTKVAAPFVPFLTEAMYRNLRRDGEPDSVHLCDFPEAATRRRDLALEAEMDAVLDVVRLARQLRVQHELKVRQPLPALHVVSRNIARLEMVQNHADLVAEELNVKTVEFGCDEAALVSLRGKPDFRRLGPRLGPRVGEAARAIAALPEPVLERLACGEAIEIEGQTSPLCLEPADVILERQPREGLVAAAEGDIVVALDTRLTEALRGEGLAREFVNKVQNLRKASDLALTQRIRIRFVGDEAVVDAVRTHKDYVQGETLSVVCEPLASPPDGASPWDLNGHLCHIAIEPIQG